MSLTLIMPCAGRSTRFNNTKPKWMLTHPSGNLMLIEALNGLDFSNVTRLVITVVKEHIDSSGIDLKKVADKIVELKGIGPEFFILNEFTGSQSETVYTTVDFLNIQGPIFIKDCDNYFQMTPTEGNSVCMSFLQNGINAVNKSYVSLDKSGNLLGIVEKSVIGDKFCVGGYSFASANDFKLSFEQIKNVKGIGAGEIYISHVIQHMLTIGTIFGVLPVENYFDWGTVEDWIKYTQQFKTIFIDLDGVLVVNSSEYFIPVWGESAGLFKNIELINKLYETGKVTIIITTSRKEEYRQVTLQQLKEVGVKYHQILFNLPHAQRILINDYSETNPFPSSVAINTKRNSDDLEWFIKY